MKKQKGVIENKIILHYIFRSSIDSKQVYNLIEVIK